MDKTGSKILDLVVRFGQVAKSSLLLPCTVGCGCCWPHLRSAVCGPGLGSEEKAVGPLCLMVEVFPRHTVGRGFVLSSRLVGTASNGTVSRDRLDRRCRARSL